MVILWFKFTFILWLMVLSTFTCSYWLSPYLLWWSVFQIFRPFFIGLCFLIIEFWEFFLYPGHMSFISCTICNYFLPICGLSFILLMVSLYKNNFTTVLCLHNINRFSTVNLMKFTYRSSLYDENLTFKLTCTINVKYTWFQRFCTVKIICKNLNFYTNYMFK